MKDLKELPSQETLEEASELEIYDIEGNTIKFSTLFDKQKTIIVFISLPSATFKFDVSVSCNLTPYLIFTQLFVENLATIPQEALAQAETRIVVIGCGEYNPIKSYKEATKFDGLFYADPTRKLYHTLGMDIENLDKTPVGEEKRSYLTLGSVSNLVMSLWRGPFKHPSQIGKQGNHAQLGGDFIFGPGMTCSFASRMKHTEDHVEVRDLMKEAGVVY